MPQQKGKGTPKGQQRPPSLAGQRAPTVRPGTPAAAPAPLVTKVGTVGRSTTAAPWRKDSSSQGSSNAGTLGAKHAPGQAAPSDLAAISRWVTGALWGFGTPPATPFSTALKDVTVPPIGKPATGPPPSQPAVVPSAVAALAPCAVEAEPNGAMTDEEMPPGQVAPLTPNSTAECAISEAEQKGITGRLTALRPLLAAAAAAMPDLQQALQAEAPRIRNILRAAQDPERRRQRVRKAITKADEKLATAREEARVASAKVDELAAARAALVTDMEAFDSPPLLWIP